MHATDPLPELAKLIKGMINVCLQQDYAQKPRKYTGYELLKLSKKYSALHLQNFWFKFEAYIYIYGVNLRVLINHALNTYKYIYQNISL